MKIYLFLIILFTLFLIGCTQPLTQPEAEQKARDYILSQWAQTGSPEIPFTIQNRVFENNEWRVTVAAEDDTGVFVLDKKGNFKRIE